MKKIILITILAPLLLINNGCKKYIDGNDVSPNQPTSVTPALLLSASQIGTFANHTGELARISAIMVQQGTGTLEQLSDVGEYVLREGDDDNEFQSIYTDALINDQTLITTFGATHKIYKGIAEVQKAMTLGLLTDTWGDVPDKEALNGLAGNYSPHFNTQQEIYDHIQLLLDSGIADLKLTDPKLNLTMPGADDFIHGGDAKSWRATAYILKARFHNHLSKRDAGGSAANALADIANAILEDATGPTINPTVGTPGTDAFAYFGEAGNNQSTYYQYINGRPGYFKLGTTFVNMLNDTNDLDPRLPFFVGQDLDGNYTGTDQATQDINSSDVGPYYNSPSSPLPLVTYVEMKFIEAEANVRAGHLPEAATASNTAVIASVTQVTGAAPDAAFITAHASLTGAETNLLERIMVEKYKAMFLQYESWTDWRRTGFPTLTPNKGTQIPRRLPTSLTERQLNPNSSGFVVSDIFKPVWWDQ